MSSFVGRHIGPNENEVNLMLNQVGYQDLDQFIQDVIPKQIYQKNPIFDLKGLSEKKALRELSDIVSENILNHSFVGQGFYGTHTPEVIMRNVLENTSFYTAYTPYQSEISQGRLELLLYFQQMIMDLTGSDVANASLLDEASAAAEAMTLMYRHNKKASPILLVDRRVFKQSISVIETRAKGIGIKVVVGDALDLIEKHKNDNPFGLIVQHLAKDGEIIDLNPVIEEAKKSNILVSVASDLLALSLIKPAGELGADVVFGTSQRFGVPIGFGGPHAAFFACKTAYQRSIPGRVIGISVDSKGNQAFRMAMQTREQHIRRDKATSNICTAQALLAIMATLYGMYHGSEGIKKIASSVHKKAKMLAGALEKNGLKIKHKQFFDTLTVIMPDEKSAFDLVKNAENQGFNLCYLGEKNEFSISIDETHSKKDVIKLASILINKNIDGLGFEKAENSNFAIAKQHLRESEYLSSPCFNLYRSETQMMRFLHRIAAKDITLNRSMIPLGSCTMKLNAAAELRALGWSKISKMHPFAPKNQTLGYQKMIDQLQNWLAHICGFDYCSIQPNAGSQGEFSGLLAIKGYLNSINQSHRDICLIPSSAHGTNPASAVMAGMKVVVVKCNEKGDVDLEDLKQKIETHKNNLAAFMITYPSTHGVFETEILEISKLIHENGGQVYLDGANLNAQMNLVRIADFADVCHYNLHKSFAIPHGGGGPGVGPIGMKKHLKDFAPGHPYGKDYGLNENGAVTSSLFGSASILVISWMYIRMTGSLGLRRCSEIAVLNANYIVSQLKNDYPVLYTGKNSLVAHECILDVRGFKEKTGISEEDIAKRLMDYGFHAPTMSFPVAGTLMIEPTESEDLAEMKRFCSAMLQIRQEIEAVATGKLKAEESPLRNAPHTLKDVLDENWDKKYSKQEAVFALDYLKENKYFAPINRVDNVYGDRNLICSCIGIENYS